MLQAKFMIFAVVALMAVGSAVAIIGGQDVIRGKYPHFAFVKSYQLKSPYKLHSCGGTLVAKQWVLTAAHCLVHSDGAEIFLDVADLEEKNEVGRETFNVIKKNYYINPKYDEKNPLVDNVALIKLPSLASHTLVKGMNIII